MQVQKNRVWDNSKVTRNTTKIGQVSDSDRGISCIFASDTQLDLLYVDATYKTVP